MTLYGNNAVPPEALGFRMPPVGLESDEPPMETPEHLESMIALYDSLRRRFSGRSDVFIGANLTVYFSLEQVRNRDFRSPDVFVCLGAEARERKSWSIWEEGGRYPDVLFELLSESTESEDRGAKKRLYQDVFRSANYFWFHPLTLELAGFRLTGSGYVPIEANERGWLWSAPLGLWIAVHERQIRLYGEDQQLILLGKEQAEIERMRADGERKRADLEYERAEAESRRAEAESRRAEAESRRAEAEGRRAEAERKRAEVERERAERLTARLKELGVDPDPPSGGG